MTRVGKNLGAEGELERLRPERLNLAIGRRCFVACKGCYNFFGRREPDLAALAKSVEAFVELGLDTVTISGGDPLTINGLIDFLNNLRAMGVHQIKVDTVGTNLLNVAPNSTGLTLETERYLDNLMQSIDYLGIPLDGWSNSSALLFRVGRPFLHDETIALLNGIDDLGMSPNVIINTVAHKQNIDDLNLILAEVVNHRSICHWNIFQYTPTDQSQAYVNSSFEVGLDRFNEVCAALASTIEGVTWPELKPTFEFRSVESRLGQYLLINSDGNVWLPDGNGQTIQLGRVFGREQVVLRHWSDYASQLHAQEMALSKNGNFGSNSQSIQFVEGLGE